MIECFTMSSANNIPENIVLVGPMGAGKTTVGKQMAKRLGKDFVDVDQELEKRTGVSINLIFEIEQEAGFRARETLMLKELLERKNCVIATGGGIIMRTARCYNRPKAWWCTLNPKSTTNSSAWPGTNNGPYYKVVVAANGC